jgi:probable HAF family extracellular repeat protein
MNARSLRAACVATLAFASVAAAAPGPYEFVPLNQAGRNYARAWEVNNAGVVVLEAGSAIGNTRAFRWENGVFTELPTLGGSTIVRSINEAGVIVGTSTGPGGIFDQQAFQWSGGSTLTVIPRPAAPNSVNNFPDDINEAGLVVGESNTAWTWSQANGYTLLPALNGGTSSTANAVNDNGWVVGNSAAAEGSRATLWRPGLAPLNLGFIVELGGTSVAFGINNANVVVGNSGAFAGFTRAFRWTEASGLVDLGAPGGRSSFANDINESGQIVGYASYSANPQNRAILWDTDGTAYELDQFLPAGSGWTLTEAYGINDLGWIVGRGTLAGQTQAFLLIPSAPPACRPDLNGDGELTFDDIQLFVSLYNANDPRADFNNDQEWTFDDIQLFVQLYNSGC